MTQDLPFAAQRRRAKAKLESARHEVLIRGPEGEQVHYDEKGKRRDPGKARTDYRGYEEYIRQQEIEADLVDPDVEKIARELIKADQFWGEAEPIVDEELQPSHSDNPVVDD